LFLLDIAFALDLASALEEAPQALKLSSNRVGFPLESFSGPLFPAIRAKKEALLGLSPDLTGALRVPFL